MIIFHRVVAVCPERHAPLSLSLPCKRRQPSMQKAGQNQSRGQSAPLDRGRSVFISGFHTFLSPFAFVDSRGILLSPRDRSFSYISGIPRRNPSSEGKNFRNCSC